MTNSKPPTPIWKNQVIIKLLKFATCETHFSFNGKFYDQVDGVAMESPLGPVLANLFMGHKEKL